ncbi:hypothetical protein GOP47_0005726 [Adiantum capillus-veneris]|uniref:BAG domain-containing protein n=1 Tax=Adiantum capillus-veneris TaxID=13818 RepID=A0A9D4V792_ADICA|nr:hypothetical protein GOP47_0005726 [Adiantum capillus-veneris]
MRRSPFYAYPFSTPVSNPYARDPYRPQQQVYRPSPPSSAPSPTPRSVISIPVFDSSSPSPPPSPPQRKASGVPLLDPSAAATRIQSCFRGYAIRQRRPLIHLRTISALKKRLEDLKDEIERPGFSNKVKSEERERLRFSESVMAVILQLDAIEGSIPDVRNQRKEATKMAIKLQDAIDAIMSSQEEVTDCSSLLAVNLESNVCSNATDALQKTPPSLIHREDLDARSLISMMQNGTVSIQEEIPDEAEVVSQDLQGVSVQDGPAEMMTNVLQEEAVKAVTNLDILVSRNEEVCAAQNDSGELIDCVKCDPSSRAAVTLCDGREVIGVPAVGIDGAYPAMVGRVIAPCKQEADQVMQEEMRAVTVVDDDGEIAVDGLAANKALKGIDVYEENIRGLRDCVSLSSPGTPCAKEGSDAVDSSEDRTPVVEELMNTQEQSLTEQRQDKPPGVPQDGLQDLDASDNVLLKKLSEECGQLKYLLGKLLAQSKAQSKVISALGDRLEMLEQQKQRGCQNKAQREKRKLSKGSNQREKCCKYP